MPQNKSTSKQSKELFLINSYAHDEQRVNPGQVRRFVGVLYKL